MLSLLSPAHDSGAPCLLTFEVPKCFLEVLFSSISTESG